MSKGSRRGAGRVMNRWLVVLGAVLIQLCLGAMYAWSVFTPALQATTPGTIEAVYGAAQLGVDTTSHQAMKTRLERPRGRLKELAGLLKGTVDAEARGEYEAERKRVAEQVDSIVRDYVPTDRLEALAYGLSTEKTQWIFSVCLVTFALVMVLAGRMMPWIGPRRLAITGGLVLGLGFILAGLFAGKDFRLLMITVGLIAGAGIGLTYVVPIAVGMRWFPDRKGLITGLSVAGFGFGALIWVKLADEWGNLIADYGLGFTFVLYGAIFALACVVGSIWMVNPPHGWVPEGWKPPDPQSGSAASAAIDIPSGKMLKLPQYYMIAFSYAFGSAAGLMTIGLMKAFPMGAMMSRGMDWAAASAAAGTAMAFFFALANGIGRIAWGAMSDKLGRKVSIIIMMATQGVIVILFQWMAGIPALLYLGATLIGFNYGGMFALFPTITADTFGARNLAQNYGWVFLAYGAGALFGPVLGGRLGDLGNFPLAFTICGALCLVAAVLIALVRRPSDEQLSQRRKKDAREAKPALQ